MKKTILMLGVVAALVSCGSQSSEAESTADSSMITDANTAPIRVDTPTLNSKTGSYPIDSNARTGDSVSGTSPQSRSTTPRRTTTGN